MEIISAEEYVACVQTGHKPTIAMVGPLVVTEGVLTQSGKYILVIDGNPYEVNSNFRITVDWELRKS